MKFYVAPLLSALLLAGCSNISHKPSHEIDRSVASGSIVRRFLEAAVEAEDNVARESLQSMENKLLKEVKTNPTKYGLTKEASEKLGHIDDIKEQRIMAEILAQAPDVLKFGPKARAAAMKEVQHEAGIASQIALRGRSLEHIQLTNAEQSGLGQEISLRIKHLKNDLVSRKVASEAQAEKISRDLLQASKDLAKNAKGDPAQMMLARQIIEYSSTISSKTGKSFLGKGGCMRISGRDVLENKAEIAFRTLSDVESQGIKEYDDLGRALQKNYSDVTKRVDDEACKALKILTSVGGACPVYAPELSPKGC